MHRGQRAQGAEHGARAARRGDGGHASHALPRGRARAHLAHHRRHPAAAQQPLRRRRAERGACGPERRGGAHRAQGLPRLPALRQPCAHPPHKVRRVRCHPAWPCRRRRRRTARAVRHPQEEDQDVHQEALRRGHQHLPCVRLLRAATPAEGLVAGRQLVRPYRRAQCEYADGPAAGEQRARAPPLFVPPEEDEHHRRGCSSGRWLRPASAARGLGGGAAAAGLLGA
mmetsp:Transcript_6974/g.25704  ORF Transcript_6974/g.25704 Transcript_6974/m.25704 type:complete len:227 (+) Transcript_6974:834-1514(+)